MGYREGPAQLERKRLRERERRKHFTEEQKTAVRENARLYAAHRRSSDESFLKASRDGVRKSYAKYKDKRAAEQRERTWQTRIKCLRAYSAHEKPNCACCGESHLEFLTLDHIADRRSSETRVGGNRFGTHLYAWLIRMNFPAGFRVLCFNCNCARGTRGFCPHELELEQRIEQDLAACL